MKTKAGCTTRSTVS